MRRQENSVAGGMRVGGKQATSSTVRSSWCTILGEWWTVYQGTCPKLLTRFTMTVVLKCREAGIKQEGRVDEDYKAREVAEVEKWW